MSLFDSEEFEVCKRCKGTGTIYDEASGESRVCACQTPAAPAPTGDQLRDEGIERSYRAADEEWKRLAALALRRVARFREKFTTDAIWAILDREGVARPREPRAMAGVLMKAKAEGICVPTDDPRVNSTRPEHHSFPLRVWRSLVVEEDGA